LLFLNRKKSEFIFLSNGWPSLIYLFIEKFMLKILTRLQVTPGLNADIGQKSEQKYATITRRFPWSFIGTNSGPTKTAWWIYPSTVVAFWRLLDGLVCVCRAGMSNPGPHQDPGCGQVPAAHQLQRYLNSCLMDWCVCAGLAFRTLDPTKILVVGKSRLLINCSGILTVAWWIDVCRAGMSNPGPHQDPGCGQVPAAYQLLRYFF
jgi:hypothetical protein